MRQKVILSAIILNQKGFLKLYKILSSVYLYVTVHSCIFVEDETTMGKTINTNTENN